MVNCEIIFRRAILATESIPVKYVFPAKALLNSSSLYHLQQLRNPENCRDVEGSTGRRDCLIVVLQNIGLLHEFEADRTLPADDIDRPEIYQRSDFSNISRLKTKKNLCYVHYGFCSCTTIDHLACFLLCEEIDLPCLFFRS